MRLRAALAGFAVAVLVAPAAPARATPAASDDATIAHVLSRFAYGPRPGDVERVRAMGIDRWLERQLAPDTLDDSVAERQVADLRTLTLSIPDLLREYPRPDAALRAKVDRGEMTREQLMERYPRERRPYRIVDELAAARAVRAVSSERQLHEVMVDVWFNHFNVSGRKADVRWYVTAYERDVIRPHALGRFPDLLRATARHPAMLFFLDNWLSVREGFTPLFGMSAGRRGGLNENYARELLELHTLGVDGGYTQQDVREVARAFTGWTLDRPGDGRFLFRPRFHDDGAKTVLGRRLPAGGGEQDGERVLDLLARHPSTARFVATRLARRFVSDDPPPALVDRVAATYTRTDGDIRAMLRTIAGSPEFLAPEARRAKIKRPLEFVASAVRAVDGTTDSQGGLALVRAVTAMGEDLVRCEPPTGYPDRADAWVSAGALLARMNFALALASGRVPGVRVDLDALVAGVDRTQPHDVLRSVLASPVGAGVSPETRAVLAARMPDGTDLERVVALVIGAPEFQRR